MSWLEDIPGVKDVIDGTGYDDVTAPRRGKVRLTGAVTVQDNPADGVTEIVIGTTAGPSAGIVDGTSYGFAPQTSGADGYVLTMDGSGEVAWEAVPVVDGSRNGLAPTTGDTGDGYVLTVTGDGSVAWEPPTGGGTYNVVDATQNGLAPDTSDAGDGYVLMSDGYGDVTWEFIDNVPVPEKYLVGAETADDHTADGTWHIPIQRMLDANLVGYLIPGRTYKCSADINFNDQNTLDGRQGTIEYFSGSTDHNNIVIDSRANCRVLNVRINGNYQGDGTYTATQGIAIIGGSGHRIHGCTIYDYGLGGTISCGVMLHNGPTDCEISGNTFKRFTPTGEGFGVGFTATGEAAGCRVTGNTFLGGIDGTEDFGLYAGVTMLGSVKEFLIAGNTMRQCGHGVGAGYAGIGNTFAGSIDANVMLNCQLNGVYCTGGSPPGKILNITNNVMVGCGGQGEFIGRASIWVNVSSVNVDGNLILNSGYTTASVARAFHFGAVYCPSTGASYGVGGSISNNYVVNADESGVNIECPGDLKVNDNYFEARYPIVLPKLVNGPTGNLQVVGNTAKIVGSLAGNGVQINAIVGNVFDNILVAGNTVIGNGIAGGAAYSIGEYVTGGLVINNTARNCSHGIAISTTTAEFLSKGLYIRDNHIINGSYGVSIVAVGAGSEWILVERNTFTSVVSGHLNVGGAGAARVYLSEAIAPCKVVLGTVAPSAGAGTWAVGDRIICTTVTDDVVMLYCSVAGDPGTWVPIAAHAAYEIVDETQDGLAPQCPAYGGENEYGLFIDGAGAVHWATPPYPELVDNSNSGIVAATPGTLGSVLKSPAGAGTPAWFLASPGAWAADAYTSSTTAIPFVGDARITWTGSGTPTLTFNATGAVDGATVTVFIPAGQLAGLALSADLSPASNFAVANFIPADPYLLTMTYLASGPCILTTGMPVTDL